MFSEQPNDLSPRIRVHREDVGDARPVLTVLIAVAHQTRGDRVAVAVVADQEAAAVITTFGFRVSRMSATAQA
jgi:hypothetical protein